VIYVIKYLTYSNQLSCVWRTDIHILHLLSLTTQRGWHTSRSREYYLTSWCKIFHKNLVFCRYGLLGTYLATLQNFMFITYEFSREWKGVLEPFSPFTTSRRFGASRNEYIRITHITFTICSWIQYWTYIRSNTMFWSINVVYKLTLQASKLWRRVVL
jgi:hypothetical protein